MRKASLLFAITALLLSAALALPDSAGAADEAVSRLMSAKSFKCEFEAGSRAEWATQRVRVKQDGILIPLFFADVDIEGGKATSYLGSRKNAREVSVISTRAGITFIDYSDSGTAGFTSIYPVYKWRSERFIFVHSRHDHAYSVPSSAQYHGSCEVIE